MRRKKLLLAILLAAIPLALAGWGGYRAYRAASAPPASAIPTTRVKRGDVTFTIAARGELQGGNSEMLIAPMTGGGDSAITFLRQPGEIVQAGDEVVRFDTTEQEFKLREAEADLAEAEQHVAQARAESVAKQEESRYALLQAEAELRLAELETRRNELVAALVARQNDLAAQAAGDRLRQLQQDLASRKATTEAGVAIQEAGLTKARVKAEMARRNIQSMTLRARSEGYVSIQQNQRSDVFFTGMQLPAFQVGDLARAGMAVAQIPDLKNWEVSVRIGELDRGHLQAGQQASIRVIAVPGQSFQGKVKGMGGTTGAPWDRYFDTRISIENPAPELRPGMSARILITTGVTPNTLWLPSQALFDSDGRAFVYLRQNDGSFVPSDVKLIRRGESQVVISGLTEGRVVALANPVQQSGKRGPAGAMQALPK